MRNDACMALPLEGTPAIGSQTAHLRGDGGQRVGDALGAVQAAVHVQHEVVERRAAQLRAGRRLKPSTLTLEPLKSQHL